ncbi:MAG: hypothetical protein IKI64_04575 [Clostridia bacterium]|nr:hypothetical protein [Clostridia bacterium]
MKIRKLFAALIALAMVFAAVPALSLAEGTAAVAGEAAAMAKLDSAWAVLDKVEAEAIASGMDKTAVIGAVYAAALNLENVDLDGFSDFDEDGFFFTVDGMCCVYDYRLRNEIDNSAKPVTEKVVFVKGSGSELRDAESPNVFLIAPYYGHDNSFTDQYKNEAQSIARETGGDYLLIQSTAATGPAIAENFTDKGVVFFDSHGTQSGTSSYLCLTTNAGITQEDYNNGWAVRAGSAAYIDGRYVENHVNATLSNPLVWMAICEGMKRQGQGTTGAALLRAGAGCVYGYSQSVTFAGDYEYEETFWTAMKEDAATVAEAYALMTSTHGIPDPYGNAYPIVMSPVDSFPDNPDGPQVVNCDWTLFGALNPVELTDYSLSISTLQLYETYQYTVSFNRVPENANAYELVWTSSNPAVASVSGNSRRAVINGVSAGSAVITCAVMVNGQLSGTATVDVTVVPNTALFDSLNADGGTLMFDSTGEYRFLAEEADGRLYAVSGNRGANNSTAALTLSLPMQAGETLSFDYFHSTEQNYDFYYFKVNGQQMQRLSGESNGWKEYVYTAASDGTYNFEWSYVKDPYVGDGEDCVKIDNVRYSGMGVPAPDGDIDGSGSVNVSDGITALRIAMGLLTASEQQLAHGDVDGDGSINMGDAITILRMAMGLID